METNANQVTKVSNGLAEAFGMVQQQNGIFVPAGAGGPAINRQDTVIASLRNSFISNNRSALSQAYCEIGLVETVVDLPVDDAFRGGLDIKSKQLDEDDIEELRLFMETNNDLAISSQTCKWDRLFGAAATIILDGRDLSEPFDLEAVDEGDDTIEFHAADMWELDAGGALDDDNDRFRKRVAGHDFQHFRWYGERVHKSRVMLLKGKVAPSFVRTRLRGWGLSVVETLIRSINQYLKATDLGFEVLDEFKLDVYRFADMVNTLILPGGQETIYRRVALANSQKSYQNAIVLDKNDEYDSKQIQFTGLAEAMGGFRMQVASDTRIPETKLFGQTSGAMNSGEDQIENYNSMIESTIRARYKHHQLKMTRIRCMQLFGYVPVDLSIHWKSLRMLRAVDEETVKTQKFQRIAQASAANKITDIEYRDAVNKGGLIDVRLETTPDVMAEIERTAKEAPAGETDDDAADDDDQDEEAYMNDLGIEQPVTVGFKARVKRIMQRLFGDDQASKPRLPKPYLRKHRAKRLIQNSADYDRAVYEAAGGDSWIDAGRAGFFQDPVGVDKALWERCGQQTIAVYGKPHWQFQAWLYAKLGGKYNAENQRIFNDFDESKIKRDGDGKFDSTGGGSEHLF